MSKNVAVFVDVANIFYAAKAAGVDIDYVTLLKSATAGRDFVRAYAYTGLDPDNENQRQFHSFLARSGYKVVSKDIRKYGDGRIKANLDIELVVDMMRMAEKLDVAVVVSGDGDFAPAIHAVQQQGVRVEVISFRGNTSSDLIDAADVFIDIANIARVEKGVRSGRRVAAEGDLSMTEVPDKESGVAPRRRRREGDERSEHPDRGERPARRRGSPAVAAEAERQVAAGQIAAGQIAAGLVALPGEKLARGGGATDGPAPLLDDGIADEAFPEREGEGGAPDDEGRRRRRRRGGRGRGRGARGAEGGEPQPVEAELEAPEYPDEVPTLPQHSAFGSVWDSQIGVPADRGPATARPDAAVDDEEESEPDVPEYLLAERRQQDRRRAGRGGRGGGYRTALDRERFGVGRGTSFSRAPARGGKGPRPVTAGRSSVHTMEPIEQTPGGDSWSEVPPEVQELLRAELARRQPPGRPAGQPRTPGPDAEPGPIGEASPATGAARPARTRPRRTAPTAAPTAATAPTADATTAGPTEAGIAGPTEAAAPKRTTRRRTTKASEAEAGVAEPTEAAAPKRTTRRRTTKASEADPA